MQQRASEKITFPDYWTNTCCSHPLYTDSEIVEENQLGELKFIKVKTQAEISVTMIVFEVSRTNSI